MKENEKPLKLSTFSDAFINTARSIGKNAELHNEANDNEGKEGTLLPETIPGTKPKEDPEYTLWRACRLYCKMNGITQAEACDILKDDPELIHEWATKND